MAVIVIKECETVRGNGTACNDTAIWVVSVGERKTDQQLSCEVHLDETCRAMYEAESRLNTILHVKSSETVAKEEAIRAEIDKRKVKAGGNDA